MVSLVGMTTCFLDGPCEVIFIWVLGFELVSSRCSCWFGLNPDWWIARICSDDSSGNISFSFRILARSSSLAVEGLTGVFFVLVRAAWAYEV